MCVTCADVRVHYVNIFDLDKKDILEGDTVWFYGKDLQWTKYKAGPGKTLVKA